MCKYLCFFFFVTLNQKYLLAPTRIPQRRVPKTTSNLLQSPPIYTDSVASRNKSFHLFMYIQNIFKLSILPLVTNSSSKTDPAASPNASSCSVLLAQTRRVHTQGTMKRTLIKHEYEHVKLSSPHCPIKSTVQKKKESKESKRKTEPVPGRHFYIQFPGGDGSLFISSLSPQFSSSSSSPPPILAKSSFFIQSSYDQHKTPCYIRFLFKWPTISCC